MTEQGGARLQTSPGLRDDAVTVAAIGMLAAVVAALAHVTLGHGLACAIAGGRIALMTATAFKCSVAAPTVDVAGPLVSFWAGILLAIGAIAAPRRTWLWLFTLVGAAVNLGWFAGQLVYDAVLDTGDWAQIARARDWPLVWRLAAIVVGVGAYIVLARFLAARSEAVSRRSILIAWAAAGASAAIAGAAWPEAPIQGALAAVEAICLAPVGFVGAMVALRPVDALPAARPRSWPWILGAALAFTVFVLVQGGGLVPAG